jgi:hypothetical protein
MIRVDTNLAKWISLFIASILPLMVLINPAVSQEVVLTLHENLSLENCTLRVEDIDIQAAKVWLLLQSEQQQPRSMVLGINNSTSCEKQTLMVTAIYAGEKADLVCLRINSS